MGSLVVVWCGYRLAMAGRLALVLPYLPSEPNELPYLSACHAINKMRALRLTYHCALPIHTYTHTR